ncbi:MAG: oxidoreductase [Litorilinea sp.]|nr:MAG: oxidoreductase [Litorilinea sp.]
MTSDAPLRFGILGAARIAPRALIGPARQVPGVVVAAIAARNPDRARRFAARHGIPRVYETYADLVADPDIDALYIPLPNSLHHPWTLRGLETGKHVLCEKPLAANATEAAEMVQKAQQSGQLLMEAFHYRYHPLAARMKAIVDSGELGTIRHVEAHFCIPTWRPWDIRYRYDLAGGALMDTGCYCVHLVRFLAGAEPEVTRARAWLRSPQVDRRMEADLRFADGRTARIVCSLWSATLLRVLVRVEGDAGELTVLNPILPHLWHRLQIRTATGVRRERVPGESTYVHQLRAFVQAVQNGTPIPTDGADGLANMRVLDAIYRAAGLAPRST